MISCDHCHRDFDPDGTDGVVVELCGESSFLAGDAGFCICEKCLASACNAIVDVSPDPASLTVAVTSINTLLADGYITRERGEELMDTLLLSAPTVVS